MIRIKKQILFLLLVVLCSCAENPTAEERAICINMSADLESNHPMSKYKYANFTDSVAYLLLETTSDNLIEQINNIHFAEDRILILDRAFNRMGQVFVFDRQGKFVTKISKQGRGPQEYVVIHTAMYDDLNRLILIYDSQGKKILYYDYDGNFVKKTDNFADAYFRGLIHLPDGGFMCYAFDAAIGNEVKGGANALWRADSQGNCTKVYQKTGDAYPLYGSDFFSYFDRLPNGDVLIRDGFNSNLYRWDHERDSVMDYLSYAIQGSKMELLKGMTFADTQDHYMHSQASQEKGNYVYTLWSQPYVASLYYKPDGTMTFIRDFDFDLPVVSNWQMIETNLPDAYVIGASGGDLSAYLENEQVSESNRNAIRSQCKGMTPEQIEGSNPLLQILYVKK